MSKLLITLLAGALAVMAASIDGKWTAEIEQRGKQGSEVKKVAITMDFKSDGSKLMGTVSAGKKGAGTEIQNGKIEGDKITFTTAQKNKDAEMKFVWTGTLSGDELKGERTREGGKRGVAFTAKRAN